MLEIETVSGAPAISHPPSQFVAYNKKVLIGLPWQKITNPVTAFCVARLVDSRRCACSLNFGDAFVAHTRNSIGDLFLASDLEYLCMIDDDMVPQVGSAEVFRAYTGFNFPEPFMSFNTIDRLMSHGKTLVGALYYGRQALNQPAVFNEAAANKHINDYVRKGPYDEIRQTRWVGTGCILVHRKVFEDIEKKFPRLARGVENRGGNWFTSTEASLVDSVEKIRDEFQGAKLTGEIAYDIVSRLDKALALSKQENPLGTGEDVAFCLRATAAGHPAYVDLGLRAGHLGSYCY
jgi:hypothetical protein